VIRVIRPRAPDSLLARSFLLIALLLVLSALASFQLYRVYEREPRGRELAQQTVSIVNLTRAALISADPFLRRELLLELDDREGIRIFPALPGDSLEPLPDDPLFLAVAARVREALGPGTRFAYSRDGEAGFWVSFLIDVDEFWVALPRGRFEPEIGWAWFGWALGLLGLALAGGWFIASTITRPLAALAAAAKRLGKGETPEPLAEEGPRELRDVSMAFNRMAGDLASLERERATVLAGISHDLRTPLSRLRLALELAGADAVIADGMTQDIDEIDGVIGQFLDYARGVTEPRVDSDLAALLEEIAADYQRRGRRVEASLEAMAPLSFAPQALRRAVVNLIENALRHAGEPVEITARGERTSANTEDGAVLIEVLDRGPGIPESEAERLKQPFTRLDASRAGASGAGLGLAIVERIARSHGGRLDLLPREGGGLRVRLRLPRQAGR